METVIERLKSIRKEFQLTQDELAAILGMSKQTYSTIELNKRKIHVDEIIKLHSKFNINPNWLLLGYGNLEYNENYREVELMNLILDYRYYGNEVDAVRKEIIKKILLKFYEQKYNYIGLPQYIHIYGHRLNSTFIKILESTNFSDVEENAKNYLRDKIEKYQNKSPFLLGIKKELYLLVENIDNKDCNYILKNVDTTISLIDQKISILDKKINNYLPDWAAF
jgi:transcriptional regulator with XRE-family HTH domain